jgi:quinol monooxygenase YgiN
MTEPVVFVSHFRIKEGKLGAFKKSFEETTQVLQADKPRTSVFLAFANNDGTDVSFIHVFADAEAMDAHVQGAEERSKAAYDFMDPAGWEIYGAPSAAAMQVFEQAARGTGVPLIVQPESVGGFLRLQSGKP